ncbi:hypothetical protein FBUS_07330 [Fasciolopsis buskii]|uniref:Uncharacterized protein n=1 Tax=Fasciolopsis buskii TaxID=27845 RepID=A0A8E0RVT8_9TREM|nr:hypothetical protein FBUS_07330 [Fasciolopsis buski]
MSQAANILREIRSCSQVSNVLFFRNAITTFHVVCILSCDHHLKLFILRKGDQEFRLIWEKVLNPSHVEIIHLIPSKRCTHTNLFINLFMLESFTFSEVQTSLFSLFTLSGVLSDENLSISLKDTVIIPFSTTMPKSLVEFPATPASCDIFEETKQSIVWFIAYIPSCMRYFILTLSHSNGSVDDFRLHASTDKSQLSTDLNPSWYPLLRCVKEHTPLDSFFAVHSRPDSKQLVGHSCKLLANREMQCFPFLIQLPEEVFGSDEAIVSNMISSPVDSTRALLSVVISPSHTRAPTLSYVFFVLVTCSAQTVCTPIRLCEINLPIESPVASFTLLDEIHDCYHRQYLIQIAPTVLAGRVYLNMFAWSTAELLNSTDAVMPLQLSFQMPIETPLFCSITDNKLSHIFARLNEVGFLYDSQVRTVHILGHNVSTF